MLTRSWSHWRSVAENVAIVIMAAAVAWLAFVRPVAPGSAAGRPPEPPLPTEPISLAGAQTVGSQAAKVALVVYSDFQCPYCGEFARDTLPDLQAHYVTTGKVLLAFRQFPLPIHPFAEDAAEAALCAARQGKFWAYHDDLFADPQTLATVSLEARAARLGLKTTQFSNCLSGESAAQVQADRSGAGPLGITGTPTFLAGSVLTDGRLKVTHRFSGAQPLTSFQAILDRLIADTDATQTVRRRDSVQ